MSTSLVRKSLLLVDTSLKANKKSSRQKAIGLKVPENIAKYKSKLNSSTVSTRKLTVGEVRKKFKSKEQILQENLKKIELIRKIDKVNLDKEIVDQIIERAVTKKPIKKLQKKSKKDKKTVFTEGDFKKFEEEYFGE